MSWIKIRRENTELLVPEESFECLFEWQGFKRIDEPKPTQAKPKVTEKKRVVVEKANGTRKSDADKPNQD